MHYGYWVDGEKPTAQNFAQAQENHSNLIINHVPKGIYNILDVGSGSGNLALKLINEGYVVDCVIPSEYLADQIHQKLVNRSKIYVCGFENMFTDEVYDLILFSESFQYVNMVESLQKAVEMLKPGGYLLICDFFRQNINKS